MYPVDFPGSNLDLLKPAEMTDEECMSVRAYKGVTTDGYNFIMIAFKPSYEDIQAIQRGEPIYIRQLGGGFHPLAAFTLDEKGDINV